VRRTAAALALLAAATAACGGGSTSAASTTTAARPATTHGPRAVACKTVKAPPARAPGKHSKPPPLPPGKSYTATVTTNCGVFRIALDRRQSPHAVASIVALARSGYFDRTIFHRIVPGFVIQGGDPTQTGTGGPGYSTVDTPPRGARYVRGVVAMAKTQTEAPGTAGSQFFVVTAANAGLPPDYAIVGRVTSGLPVVMRIGRLGDVQTEQPTRVVEVQTIRISES
jgi:cyclophilin family peptidyl-prolyl cis-trans isomerase